MEVREHTAEGIYYYEATFASPRDAELPLVVAFHGRGGAPFRPEGLYYGVRAPMRLVVPRGPRPLGGGFAWFEANATDDPWDVAAELRAAAERAAAFVAAVAERHPTAGVRIATGFSQGGAVALALAVLAPSSITAALVAAAFMPEALIPREASVRVPIRMMHGTGDPTVPFAPTRALAHELRARGYDVELVPFDTAEHVMTAEMGARLHLWLGAMLGGDPATGA